MRNGGGPACLRLRVVCDPRTVDARFLVDAAKLDRLADVIERHWPEEIAIDRIGDPALIERIVTGTGGAATGAWLVGLTYG